MAQKIDQSEEEEKLGTQGRRFLCELAPKVQRLISSFLYGGDLVMFRRLISKSLTSNLIPSISGPSMNIIPQPHLQNPGLPYLISLQEDDVLRFHHPTTRGFHRTHVPELSGARIRFSNHGWLLMQTQDHDIFFFEPFSREKIELPKYPTDSFASMCFSSPPTSPDCFVIGVQLYGTICCIIKRGEESWTKRSIKQGRRPFLLSPGTAPLMQNGLCYCLGDSGHLFVFDPNAERPNWNVIGNGYPEYLRVFQCFLLAKNKGQLLRVLLIHEERRIEISTLSIGNKTWKVEHCLGNKLLFLSSMCSFLASSDLRGMHNKIYLPKFYNDANLFYSTSARRYLSFHDDYSSRNCFGDDVKDFPYSSVWLKPVSSHGTVGEESFKW